VHLTVGCEGFRGRWSPDGKLYLRGVAEAARDCADLKARRAGFRCRHGETNFHAVVRGDCDAASLPVREFGVRRAHGDFSFDWTVGLVLHDDGQLEAVAEVQEAGR